MRFPKPSWLSLQWSLAADVSTVPQGPLFFFLSAFCWDGNWAMLDSTGRDSGLGMVSLSRHDCGVIVHMRWDVRYSEHCFRKCLKSGIVKSFLVAMCLIRVCCYACVSLANIKWHTECRNRNDAVTNFEQDRRDDLVVWCAVFGQRLQGGVRVVCRYCL